MDTELLAPAGDIEAAYSAFYFGADAVYLGLRQFSARAEAINFSAEDLDEITAYAHANGKKVYVALNTVLQETELPLLLSHLQVCQNTHVDALIVQDLGVARIIKKTFPSLVLHASTQLAVHNTAGALTLKKAGFERVVLARELSLSEIQKIQKESGMEVEVFIHGALCYSYSGLCSFSSMTTGRSANRGKCVYACRSTYKLNNRQYHPFSMKDLALEKEVCQLKGFSLKIEGRKKNALYVGAVTDYYRRILDTGRIDAKLTDNLKQIFARPWTKLHFNGKNKNVIDPDFVGHRGLPIGHIEKVFNGQISFKPTHSIERFDGIQIDIAGIEKPFGFSAENLMVNKKNVFMATAGQNVTLTLPPKSPFIQKGAAVYLSSSTKVKRSYPYEKPKKGIFKNRLPLTVSIYIDTDTITAVCEETSVTISQPMSPAKDVQKVISAAETSFAKTGDTSFEIKNIQLFNPKELFVPVSTFNELRRQLLEKYTIELAQKQHTPILPSIPIYKNKNIAPKWRLKTDNPHLLKTVDISTIDEIIIEINPQLKPQDIDFIPQYKTRLALPTIIRSGIYQKTIDDFINAGYDKWQIGNIGGFTFLPPKTDIVIDDTIPLLNTQAITHITEMGANGITFSVEDTKDNIQKLAQSYNNTTLVVYQDVPLFLSANCIRENSCTDCTQKEEHFILSNGKEQFEAISKNCLTTVVKNVPYYIGDLAQNIPATWFRMDFCHKQYTSVQIQNLIKIIQAGKPLKMKYTGNFTKSFA